MNNVTLRINGQIWGGWTAASISAGIDRLARDFNIEVTHHWAGKNHTQAGIRNGDAVEVYIGHDPVITGYVEATPIRYDAHQITRGIVGRSKTADLIDCSVVPTQFSGRSMVQICRQLAKPFGINVIDTGAPAAVLDLQADHGETIIDVINKVLGLQQVLAYDNERGDLVIGQLGTARAYTALVLGENILSCDTERAIRDRFSDYQVAGQRTGDDEDFGEVTLSAIQATTRDKGVTRYRPLQIRQNGNATLETCRQRCQFERDRRIALTEEATYTVQGWRQGNGALWQPNQRLLVTDPVLGFAQRELLIAEVTFRQDSNGTLTELRVGPEAAYLPEKTSEKEQQEREVF